MSGNQPTNNSLNVFSGLKGKLSLWMRAYLDRDNQTTFLNQTASAKHAKYKCRSENSFCSMGSQNYRKLRGRIDKWLTEEGLSEASLKKKLIDLLSASETKFITIKGKITDQDDLPAYCTVLVNSTQTKLAGKDAVEYDEEHTVIAIDMTALEVQRRSLDMAFKVKGMYVNEDSGIEDSLARLGERLAAAIDRSNMNETEQ